MPQLASENSTTLEDINIALLRVPNAVIQVSGYAAVEPIGMASDGAVSRDILAGSRGDGYRIEHPSSDGIVTVTTPDGHKVVLDMIEWARTKPNGMPLVGSDGPLRVKIVPNFMMVESSPDGQLLLDYFSGVIAVGRADR